MTHGVVFLSKGELGRRGGWGWTITARLVWITEIGSWNTAMQFFGEMFCAARLQHTIIHIQNMCAMRCAVCVHTALQHTATCAKASWDDPRHPFNSTVHMNISSPAAG